MTEREFYNRKRELGMLKDRYSSLKAGEMLVIYGRRRVGKTELIKQFMKTLQDNRLYFYVDLIEKQGLLDSLSSSIQEQLGETVKFDSFEEFLNFINKKLDSNSFLLVIDEFQRFLDVAPEFITQLQNYWDSKLKHKKIMIILVGSSIGMIQKITNSKAGALYGRATKIKVSPFRYSDFRLMFKELSEEDKVINYSVFGGTPYYLEKAKRLQADIYQKIFELCLKKGADLIEEPKNLMEYENVRIHAKYNSILQATSSGKEMIKEIQDMTGIKPNIMPAYLTKLDELLDLIEKKDPVLGKGKLGRYGIKDNFFKFWYRFIFPNQTALNLGNVKFVSDIIKENLNAYIGRVFESIVKELLICYLNKKIKNTEIDFENIGSWWDRNGNEIDVVAYNHKAKKVLIGEVKWTSQPLDIEIVEDLVKKSKFINFKGEYGFFFASKNGFTERAIKKMKEINALHLDLKEIGELFEESQKICI